MPPPRRMVVVDDDSKVRLLLERAFRAPEFETHAFPTGTEALKHVAAIRPDCVVSDLLMPDMDGEGLLRAIRAVPGLERVPFVAVSAVRSEARIKSLLAAGANAFLLKPFPLRDLLDRVRSLLERPEPARAEPGGTSDYTSPTRPVVAMSHTMSTTAPRRHQPPPGIGPAPEPAVRKPPPPRASPEAGTSTTAPVAPVRIVPPAAPPPPAVAPGGRSVELSPPDPGLGFGRFTRVEVRGRSFIVLTEAALQPKFTVTTVITEKGVPLRKIESALPHPLAREEDHDLVRVQLDLQHDDTLRRLAEFVLDHTTRRVVWSDENRSVEAGLLAWAISAVAQLAETEAGTDETARQLRLTREKALVEEDALRAFYVTSSGRVTVDPQQAARLPRRSVRAVAGWCCAFAVATLQVEGERIVEPVRHATRGHALELERLGFYDRLQRAARS
jgi:two-component system alkaline phosphatase synthesis response regulator PhoP